MHILLVDDHPLILSALREVVEGLRPGTRVTTVDHPRQARAVLASETSFDLVLLDLQLGEQSGFELLAEWRERFPSLPIVVLSGSDRNADVLRAIDLGAMGYVPKTINPGLLVEALKFVLDGGIYVPPISDEAADAVAAVSFLAPVEPAAAQVGTDPRPSLADLALTPRQTDVLSLLLQGKPNKDIARILGVSVETVKDHVAAILRALKVKTRTQAVLAVGKMSRQGDLPSNWRRFSAS